MRPQVLDLALEVLGGGERPVHRGEAQVGDLVEIAKGPRIARPTSWLGTSRAGGPHGVLDLLCQQVQGVIVDLTALAGPAHPG